jgi:mRNA interferase MazF
MVSYVPDRGHLIWINFNPAVGREQQGRRPAVILSPRSYNKPSELVLLVPVTSRRKGYPFEQPLPEGLAIAGVVLCDQIKSMDWKSRDVQFIQELPIEVMIKVNAKIATLIT